MNFEIHIPHRSPAEPLTAVADYARELPTDEDRTVVRHLVLGEVLSDDSAATVGEFLDKLEKASPAERRERLDAARAKAGLDTASDTELRERMAEAGRQSAGRRDHTLVLTPHGFVDVTEQEQEAKRTAALLESRRRQREADQAERAIVAEQMRARERALREQLRRETPQGFPA